MKQEVFVLKHREINDYYVTNSNSSGNSLPRIYKSAKMAASKANLEYWKVMVWHINEFEVTD